MLTVGSKQRIEKTQSAFTEDSSPNFQNLSILKYFSCESVVGTGLADRQGTIMDYEMVISTVLVPGDLSV